MLLFLPPLFMSSSAPPQPSSPNLPTCANPPAHRFSTVIYPSTAVLRAESGSDVLDSLHYGRLGSPAARSLEAILARRFSAHACVLAPTRTAALVAATTASLSRADLLAAPTSPRCESRPLLDRLLPSLGVRVVRYDGIDQLERIARQNNLKIALLEAPRPPLFEAATRVAELPRIRAACGNATVLILDNLGDVVSPAEALSSNCGVDLVVSSADRSGGLLDGNSTLQIGVLLCAHERAYRKVRAAVRGRLGPTAGAPNADDCVNASLAIRTADARRDAQLLAVAKVVAALKTDLVGPIIKQYRTHSGSFDIAIELSDVASFLDSLQVIRIGDGVGGGNCTSFAWPCWADGADHSSWIVLSVGLENVEDIIYDLTTASQKQLT